MSAAPRSRQQQQQRAANLKDDHDEDYEEEEEEDGGPSSTAISQLCKTSMHVFREFVVPIPNASTGVVDEENGPFDASGVISRKCFETWMKTRKGPPSRPEKAFQRTLSAHITGLDGRKPFSPQEECAVLSVVRLPHRWPCFDHAPVRLGMRGFRALGFHEKANGATLADLALIESRYAQGLHAPLPPPQQQRAQVPPPSAPPPPQATAVPRYLPHQQQQQFHYAAPPLPPPPSQQQQQYYDAQRHFLQHQYLYLQQQQHQQYAAQHQQQQQQQQQQQPIPCAPAPQPQQQALAKRARLDDSAPLDQESRFLARAKQCLLEEDDGLSRAWERILSMARMNLLAKGWTTSSATSSKEQAERVLVEHKSEEDGGGAALLVVDVMEKQPEGGDRVLACNVRARELFGDVCRGEEHGTRDWLQGCSEEELWRLLEACTNAFRAPSSHSTSAKVRLATGQQQQQQVFEVTFTALRTEHALLVCAKSCSI